MYTGLLAGDERDIYHTPQHPDSHSSSNNISLLEHLIYSLKKASLFTTHFDTHPLLYFNHLQYVCHL
jgi:hypothetical protein